MTHALLLHFDDEHGPAQRLAQAASLPSAVIERHRFPDDELRLRLPVDEQGRLPSTLVMYRSLHHPNEKLVELMLCARQARQLGAQRLVLVAPYLAYMRQDIAFRPGEVVSQRMVGAFLAELFDGLITVDPHLHRIATLTEAAPMAHAIALSGAPRLAARIAQHHAQPLLIGPDSEAVQWVANAAAAQGWDHAVCTKQRHGDHDVSIALPEGLAARLPGRAVVLMDDVASSGHTLIVAAQQVLAAGAVSVDVAITHALLAGDAPQRLRAAGIRHVWSTDCIPHASNAIDMAPDLAQALGPLLH